MNTEIVLTVELTSIVGILLIECFLLLRRHVGRPSITVLLHLRHDSSDPSRICVSSTVFIRIANDIGVGTVGRRIGTVFTKAIIDFEVSSIVLLHSLLGVLPCLRNLGVDVRTRTSVIFN